MKTSRTVLALVLVGTVGLIGCTKKDDDMPPPAASENTQRQAAPPPAQEAAPPAAPPAAEPPAAAAAPAEAAPPADGKEDAEVFIKQTEQPAPRAERRPALPGLASDFRWSDGHWRWDVKRVGWAWTPGRWAHVYAPSAPPAPRVEKYGPAPSARHAWVGGNWRWSGREWAWNGGHWAVRTGPAHRAWVPARWDRHGGRYVMVPGHWN